MNDVLQDSYILKTVGFGEKFETLKLLDENVEAVLVQ